MKKFEKKRKAILKMLNKSKMKKQLDSLNTEVPGKQHDSDAKRRDAQNLIQRQGLPGYGGQ